jgi:hypothetical protein
LLALNQARDAELKVLAALKNRVGTHQQSIKHYDGYIKDRRESWKELGDYHESNLQSMRKTAAGVEVAMMLLEMGKNIRSLIKTGTSAMSASGKALEELNKEAMKEVGELVKLPIEPLVKNKIISWLKNSQNKPLAFLGTLGELQEKYNSLSDWCHIIAQVKTGTSLTDAVKMEIGQDLEERIKAIDTAGAKSIKQAQDEQDALRAKCVEIEKLIKECEARIKAKQEEARKLPLK